MGLLISLILAQAVVPIQLRASRDIARPLATPMTLDGGYKLEVYDRGAALNSTMIASGEIPGASIVLKFGRNADIDTITAPEDIWSGGGLYTGFPLITDGGVLAETLTVVSSSALDTAGGTGARTLRLEGLDQNFNPIAETVTLAGLTPVVTTLAFSRMARDYVVTAGSGGVNAGTITTTHTTTVANVFDVMAIGFNQSLICGYTVPAGKTGYLREVTIQLLAGANGAVTSVLWIREPQQTGRYRRVYDQTDAYAIDDPIHSGVVIPQKSDLSLRVISTATNNISVNCHFDMILLDNQ